MLFNTYVALDITDSEIRVVSINRNKIVHWSINPLPDDLIKSGIIQEPQALGVFLDAMFKNLRLPKNRVMCSLTGLPFLYRTINMPGSRNEISSEAVEREAKREMSLSAEDIYLLWQAIATNKEAKETEYFVLGIPKTSLDPLVNAFEIAGIKPYLIDLKPLALARAAAMKDALIVSLEKKYFDVIVVVGGLVRVIHSINPSIDPGDAVGNVNEIVDGLNKAIKSFNREFPQNALPEDTPVVLSGELAANNEIIKLVQDATGHPAGIIQFKFDAPSEMSPISYSGNIGLAAKLSPGFTDAANYQDINVDIFSAVRSAGKFKFKLSYAFAGMAALVLLALVYWTYDAKTGADRDLEALKPQVASVAQQLTAAQKANKDALAVKAEVEKQIQDLNIQITAVKNEKQALTSQQLDYATRVEGITDVTPRGTVIDSINMQLAGDQVHAAAAKSTDVLTYADELEKNSLFTGARIMNIDPEDGGSVSFQIAISNSPENTK